MVPASTRKAVLIARAVTGMGCLVLLCGCASGTKASNAPASSSSQVPTPSVSLPAHVEAMIPVNDQPNALDAAFGTMWVVAHHGDSVQRVDPATNKVVAAIAVGGYPGSVWNGFGYEWVLDYDDQHVWRIDPATNLAREFTIPGYGDGAGVAGLGSVWVSTDQGGDSLSVVYRINPVTLKAVRVKTPCNWNCALTIVGPYLYAGWKTNLARMDPTNGQWRIVTTLGYAYRQGIGPIKAYVTSGGDAVVTPVATSTGRAGRPVHAIGGPEALIDGDHVWIVNRGSTGGDSGDGHIQLFYPASGSLITYTNLMAGADGDDSSIVAFGSLWYSDWVGSNLVRIAEPS